MDIKGDTGGDTQTIGNYICFLRCWSGKSEICVSPPTIHISRINCLVVAPCLLKEKTQQTNNNLFYLYTHSAPPGWLQFLPPSWNLWLWVGDFARRLWSELICSYFSVFTIPPSCFFQLCGYRMKIIYFPPPPMAQIQWTYNNTFGFTPWCGCSAVDLGYKTLPFASLPGQPPVKM